MEYRSMNGVCCVRVDKGEEIIQSLMEVCRRKNLAEYKGPDNTKQEQRRVLR